MKRIILTTATFLVCFFGISFTTDAQTTSRWAIGRPSLLIDLPGKPSSATLDWVEPNPYSFLPTSWAGEDAGLRVEVGRISWPNDPNAVFDKITKKLGISSAAAEMPKISGRKTVGSSGNGYILRVIGTDPETNSGSVWAVLVRYKEAGLAAAAQNIVSNIIAEREGSAKPVLRGLGTGSFAAILPYELLPSESSSQNSTDREFEAYFDGMQVSVVSAIPAAGYVFNADGTIKDMIQATKDRADKDSFRAESAKVKIGEENAVLVTMDLKENGKPYKIYKILAIQKRLSTRLTIQTDPNNSEQQSTARQILASLKTTKSPLYGWSTYKVGQKGLMIDSPIAPKAPKQQNAVTIYSIDGPLFGYEIREVQPMFASAFDPDLSAKGYFDLNSSLSKDKNEIISIDKLLVDGFQARLIKAKITSGKYTYIRQMLLIYGGTTEWIIDIIGTEDYRDLIDRAIHSVRVNLPVEPGTVSQTIGKLGVSIRAFDQALKIDQRTVPDGVGTRTETSAAREFPGGAIMFYEEESSAMQDVSAKEIVMVATNSFLGGIGKSANLKLLATEKETHPIIIDGIGGLRVISTVSSNGVEPRTPILTDSIVFKKGNKIFTAVIVTNFGEGINARIYRSNILNHLRIGY